jgi:hypothetical protein
MMWRKKTGPYAMRGVTQRGLFGAIVTVRRPIVTPKGDGTFKAD